MILPHSPTIGDVVAPGSPDARQMGCLCRTRDGDFPDPPGQRWVNPSCQLHGVWDQ